MRKWLLRLVVGGVMLMVAIQLVPYGRDHANPPVTGEPRWDSARTERLARDACYDCHSNETEWPWYSNIAPGSWLLQRDVDVGRAELNFSEFDREQKEAEDSADTVIDGEMPPFRYLPLHPEARLSPAEKDALVRGFRSRWEATTRARTETGMTTTAPGPAPRGRAQCLPTRSLVASPRCSTSHA